MILNIDEDHPVVVGCLLEWLYEKRYAHMSICSTYEPPLGPCMAGLHIAMYEIANPKYKRRPSSRMDLRKKLCSCEHMLHL